MWFCLFVFFIFLRIIWYCSCVILASDRHDWCGWIFNGCTQHSSFSFPNFQHFLAAKTDQIITRGNQATAVLWGLGRMHAPTLMAQPHGQQKNSRDPESTNKTKPNSVLSSCEKRTNFFWVGLYLSLAKSKSVGTKVMGWSTSKDVAREK